MGCALRHCRGGQSYAWAVRHCGSGRDHRGYLFGAALTGRDLDCQDVARRGGIHQGRALRRCGQRFGRLDGYPPQNRLKTASPAIRLHLVAGVGTLRSSATMARFSGSEVRSVMPTPVWTIVRGSLTSAAQKLVALKSWVTLM